MLLGVIRLRKSTYSSEWNCVISRLVAGFARYRRAYSIINERGEDD